MQPIFITGIGTDIGKTVVAAIVTEALEAAYWKPVQAGYAQGTDSEWVAERISHPHGRILPEAYKLTLPASPHIAARQEGVQISLERIARQLTAHTDTLASPDSFAFPDDAYSPSRPELASQLSPEGPVPENIPGSPTGNLSEASSGSFSGSSTGSFSDQAAAVAIPFSGYQSAPDYLVIEGAGGLLVPLNEEEFVLDLIKQLDATVLLVSRNYLGSINHSLMTAAMCKMHGLKVAGWIFNDQYQHYESEIVRWSGLPFIASIPHHENPDSEFVRRQAAKVKNFLLAALNP